MKQTLCKKSRKTALDIIACIIKLEEGRSLFLVLLNIEPSFLPFSLTYMEQTYQSIQVKGCVLIGKKNIPDPVFLVPGTFERIDGHI